MKRATRDLAMLVFFIGLGFSGGCTKAKFRPTAPGPRVPHISNFRVEPPVVERGGQVTLRFDFRDTDGNIMDIYLGLQREVSDFTVATGIEPTLISHGRYLGLTEGTAEETITIRIERWVAPLTSETRRFEGAAAKPDKELEEIGGSRIYEVFVVDANGHVSNHLQARVDVR